MTETIKLNLIPDTTELPVLHCSQFDDGRIMYVDLVEGDQPFILAEGSVVKVNIRKLDNNVISNVCTYETIEVEEKSFSRVTVTATEQMTACYGRSYGELQITVNDTVIGTLNFYLDVEKDPMQGGIDSASEIDNLTGQIEDIVEEVIGDDYYNKSQVDNLLSGKANTSDLDNYYTKSQADTLLLGKANASDLDNYYTKSQADTLLSGKVDTSTLNNYYTKTEVDQKFLDIMPVKSVAKSPIASFYTSIDNYPIVDLKCYINPEQSGSGDPAPDNIRPITGVSSVNVMRYGVNLWDEEWENGYYNRTTGQKGGNTNTSYYRSKNFIPCLPSTTYYFKEPQVHASNNTWLGVLYYDANKVFFWCDNTTTALKTTPTKARYMTFYIEVGTPGATYNNDISINYPSTDTSYHAYTGNTYTIALGETYYGATLDVVRGKLRADRVKKTLNGSISTSGMGISSSYQGAIYFTDSSPVFSDADFSKPIMSDKLKYIGSTTSGFVYGTCANVNNASFNLFINNAQFSSSAEVVQFLTTNPFDICYYLATPIEIDLTPTQINSLLGQNNISHDGNGDIELKVKMTIQDWIDQQ